jgi:hypothetical protein
MMMEMNFMQLLDLELEEEEMKEEEIEEMKIKEKMIQKIIINYQIQIIMNKDKIKVNLEGLNKEREKED